MPSVDEILPPHKFLPNFFFFFSPLRVLTREGKGNAFNGRACLLPFKHILFSGFSLIIIEPVKRPGNPVGVDHIAGEYVRACLGEMEGMMDVRESSNERDSTRGAEGGQLKRGRGMNGFLNAPMRDFSRWSCMSFNDGLANQHGCNPTFPPFRKPCVVSSCLTCDGVRSH